MCDQPKDVGNVGLSPQTVLQLVHLQLLMMAGLSVGIWFDYAIDFAPEWEWIVSKFGADRAIMVYPTIYSFYVLVPVALVFPVLVALCEKFRCWTKRSIIALVTTTSLLQGLLFAGGEMSQRSPGWSGKWILFLPLATFVGFVWMLLVLAVWIWAATFLMHLLRLLTPLRITGTSLACYTAMSLASIVMVVAGGTSTIYLTQICEYCRPAPRLVLRCLVVVVALGSVGLAPVSLRKSYRSWRAAYAPHSRRRSFWRVKRPKPEDLQETW